MVCFSILYLQVMPALPVLRGWVLHHILGRTFKLWKKCVFFLFLIYNLPRYSFEIFYWKFTYIIQIRHFASGAFCSVDIHFLRLSDPTCQNSPFLSSVRLATRSWVVCCFPSISKHITCCKFATIGIVSFLVQEVCCQFVM